MRTENQEYSITVQCVSQEVVELKARCRELSAENRLLKKELAELFLLKVLVDGD